MGKYKLDDERDRIICSPKTHRNMGHSMGGGGECTSQVDGEIIFKINYSYMSGYWLELSSIKLKNDSYEGPKSMKLVRSET